MCPWKLSKVSLTPKHQKCGRSHGPWWLLTSPAEEPAGAPACRSRFQCLHVVSQMEYERQIASVRAQSALEGDFSISQAELSSRQAMLENASDIKVQFLPRSLLQLRSHRFSTFQEPVLCFVAGEIQHICSWQGAFCQRRPSDCGRKKIWFSWTKRVCLSSFMTHSTRVLPAGVFLQQVVSTKQQEEVRR